MPSATCQSPPNTLINPTAAFIRCTGKFRFACLGDRLVPAQRSRAIADAHAHAAQTEFRNLKAAVAECACLHGRCPVVGQPSGLAGITWLNGNRRTGHHRPPGANRLARSVEPLRRCPVTKRWYRPPGAIWQAPWPQRKGRHALQEEPEAHHGPQELTRRIASTAVRCDAKSTRVLTAVGLRCMSFLTRTGAAFSDEANLSTMACVIEGGRAGIDDPASSMGRISRCAGRLPLRWQHGSTPLARPADGTGNKTLHTPRAWTGINRAPAAFTRMQGPARPGRQTDVPRHTTGQATGH